VFICKPLRPDQSYFIVLYYYISLINDIFLGKVNKISGSDISPSSSPEPPKLSPPIDYEKTKSPDTIRDSPPVLPKIYIAIQSTALECSKQNLDTPKNWHESENTTNLPVEKEIKLNDTDGIIIHDNATTSVLLPASSSFKHSGINLAKWDEERSSPKSQDSEIQQNILEDTKAFDNMEEHRQATSPISLDNFLSHPTVNIKTDGNDIKDTKKSPAQEHIDQMAGTSDILTNKHIICEKQELEEKPKQASVLQPTISPSVIKRKITEYENYEEEKFNNGNRAVTRAVTAHEIPVIVEQSQTSATNVNILQLQSIYCGSSVAQDNAVFTDVMQNSRDIRKVNDE